MIWFFLALATFIVLHVGVAGTGMRGALVKRLGEGPYRGLFSLASAIALGALIWTFALARRAPGNVQVWTPPAWAPHAAQVLVLLGLVLAFTGLLTPNPTAIGFESKLADAEPAKGVVRITRHPFLWGVVLWGAGHLIANGDLVGMSLFAGLAVLALIGASSIDAKRAARDREGWARFKAATSSVPFAAIVAGRNRLMLGEMSWRPIAALAIFALLFWAHPFLFGVSPMGG